MSVFSKPYPIQFSPIQSIVVSLCFGVFIFLFLWLFQPFGLYIWKTAHKSLYIAGYGMVTFCGVLLMSMLVPFLFIRFAKESRWTVGLEILQVLATILVIAAGNILYSVWVNIIEPTPQAAFNYILITLIVSILPISVFILINYYRLQLANVRKAQELNQKIENQLPVSALTPRSKTLNIDGFIVDEEAVMCFKASDNYVEIYYTTAQGVVQRQIIRFTLKQVEQLVQHLPHFFRCHRSYVVNCQMVRHVSGNSQGQKLHLLHLEELIPVSRSLQKELENKLTIR